VEEEIHRQDLEGFKIGKGDIVLLKTRNSMLGYMKFKEDF
jgi:arylformamidase